MEEKIEHLNKAGIQAIVKATGVDKIERLNRLRALRTSLRDLIDQGDKTATDVKSLLEQLNDSASRESPFKIC